MMHTALSKKQLFPIFYLILTLGLDMFIERRDGLNCLLYS